MPYLVEAYADGEFEACSPKCSNLVLATRALADAVAEVEAGEYYAEKLRLIQMDNGVIAEVLFEEDF